MAILLDRERGLISLQTRNTEYQMKIDSRGVLLHLYYGGRIYGSDLSHTVCRMDRGFSGNPADIGATDRSYSLDVLPQEYSCFGAGDYRSTALAVEFADGSRACELRVQDCRIEPGLPVPEGLPAVHCKSEAAETLIVSLADPFSGLAAELQYGVLADRDVIVRAARILNRGETPFTLRKAASMHIDWQFGRFDQISFYGRHAMERMPQRQAVGHGRQSVGSVRGTSSHHYNPFSILCEPTATETAGLCFGASFLYSGEFLMETEMDAIGQTRWICGIHPDDFAWELRAGDSFQTPEVMLSCSTEGLGKLSRNFHAAIRDNVCRGAYAHRRRSVLINNWEATYFQFTGEKLVSLAEEAAGLGIELFVLDDGWFGKRDDDNSGLGDWFPNEKKLGCTLRELGERITATGMQFGLWFEPESVSIDSDLCRAHPDWVVRVPSRAPTLSRNQLILDLSRKEVQDYLIERMSAILSDAPISYVKWDLNRSLCDKFSAALDAKHQGEFAHRYVLGLYRVLETLTARFPALLIEGCSGGGGRFDAGMLYYTPQIWCSDNTDAISRLAIQYGTSFGYPVSTMGAHVSAVPNHQTGRVTPFATRGCVAMAGTFGYELDITKLSAEEKAEIRTQIETFHKHYELIQYGDYYRLSAATEPCVIWEFADPAGEKALISAVSRLVEANPSPIHFSVQGLQSQSLYRVAIRPAGGREDDTRVLEGLSGAALACGGLTLTPEAKEYFAWEIEISRESGKA